MAAYYVRLLLSFRPEGPYILGGWCYGGIVAVEMAQQLVAQGRKIDLLVLIDTWARPPESGSYGFYLNRVGCFLRMGTRRWIRYLKAKAERKMRRGPENVSSVLAVNLEYGHLANRKHVLKMNMQAVKGYRSRPYPGRVILFNAEDPGDGIVPDPKSGWSTLAAEIETHPIASSHKDMLKEPQVKFLAEQIRECIDRVRPL